MSQPLITTADLAIGYGSKAIHEHLDLRVEHGRLVCLLGPNGAGKSTLLRTLAGAQPMLAGKVTLGGRELAQMSAKELARAVALVYTDRTLAGALTVRELVGLGRHPYTGLFGRLSSDDRQAVERALCDTGIADLASKSVAHLSDGERQKAMIARALAQSTELIVMDEPTAFLDVASRLEVMGLLARLTHEQGKSILLSTHDVASAVALADELWLMRTRGGVICGNPGELSASPDGLPTLFDGREVVYDATVGDFRPMAPL